ncbi:glycosyltransferase [Paenibacillus sp. PL91]|uniref:glycosyltransferase n=1 Tax=Paenibacillus sp. PL91 TaxID=2729538 RepID=UPI00145ED77F|nr:glycosyltransferase [Paenibacillus sp. PL91]MBC9200993.1 glycosyltransferase [Paenibacillus sp. PL91]
MIAAQTFLTDQRLYLPKHRNASPQISVILPLPKGSWSHHFAATIQSILDQSMKDFELIIVGDGCDQTVINALVYLQANEPRIIYAHHDTWSELPALRINEGLLLAKGKYIAYMFTGVEWERDALLHLYREIVHCTSPTVVYGSSMLPTQQVFGARYAFGLLMKNNIIPNHAVLHHAQIVHEIGGYDCHIAVRQFCDWDFWMRCAKRYSFVYVDRIISKVRSVKAATQAATDLDVSRFICSINRSDRLRLSHFHQFSVDDVLLLYRYLDSPLVDVIKNRYMYPWLLSHAAGRIEAIPPVPRESINLLVVLVHKDASAEICFTNFQEASNNSIIPFFYYEDQVTSLAIQSADVIILLRLSSQLAIDLQSSAIALNKPVIYLLDDDLLGMHELKEWVSWGPGSPIYNRISHLIKHSDAVATYSPLVQEVVRPINPRVCQLNTNILRKYVESKLSDDRKPNDPVRIGIINTGSRAEELRFIWPAIFRLSHEKGNSVHFEVWGEIPNGLPNLLSPVTIRSKTFSYYQYLDSLTSIRMDLMLVPLFDNIRLRNGKTPIKYLEATAAGAIGIYSNNLSYVAVNDGVTGVKIRNNEVDWYRLMKKWVETPYVERKKIWSLAKEHILNEFTTESQLNHFYSFLELSKFHASARAKRFPDGKPRIAYLLNPEDQQFYDHAMIAERYGIELVWRLPETSHKADTPLIAAIKRRGEVMEYIPDVLFHPLSSCSNQGTLIKAIADWIKDHRITIIHTPAFNILVAQAAQTAGIPYAAFKISGKIDPGELFKQYNRFI